MASLYKVLKDIDLKYSGLAIFLCVVSYLTYLFNSEVLNCIKLIFEFKDLDLFAGGLATILTLTNKIKHRKIKFSSNMTFNDFRIPLEDVLSFIGNPITLVCAISLAKGIFLQASENVQYFPLYRGFDIAFIGLVTAYLFFFFLMELIMNVRGIMFSKLNKSEKITPIPESEAPSEIPKL